MEQHMQRKNKGSGEKYSVKKHQRYSGEDPPSASWRGGDDSRINSRFWMRFAYQNDGNKWIRYLPSPIQFITIYIYIFIFSFLFFHTLFFLQWRVIAPVEDAKNDIYQACEKLSYKERCYAKEFGELTKKHPIEFSINVLKKLQEEDVQARGCHFIAHSISIAETLKDENKWKDILKKLDPRLCTGGFFHGVIEVSTSLNPDVRIDEAFIRSICREEFENASEWSCAHLMGHLMLVEADGVLSEAVQLCTDIKDAQLSYDCNTGAFMEYTTRENLVSHGIGEKVNWSQEFTQEVQEICEKHQGVAATACWRELSHLFVHLFPADPAKLYEKCYEASSPEGAYQCYIHGVNIMAVSHNFDRANLPTLCKPYLKDMPRLLECNDYVVRVLLTSSLTYLDDTVKYCNSFTSQSREECFRFMTHLFKETPELRKICAKLPTEYRAMCR